MTTEELKVRVSLDTSGLKQDINRTKSTLNDLNKQTEQAMNGTKKGTSGSNEQMKSLHETMKALVALNFGEAFLLSMKSDNIKQHLKQIKTSFKAAGDSIKESIGNIQNGFGAIMLGTRSKFMDGGLKDSMAHFKEAFSGTALKNMATGFKAMGAAAAAAIAPIVAITTAITALAGAINAIARARVNAQQAFAAEKIGMTVDAYGEWGYVITQLGGEVEDLTDYVRTLSAAQNEVRAGSEDLTAAFARLGMSAEEISTMSQTEMFTRTIAGLQNLESEVERVSLAYKIFGEDDGAKVTTLLHTNNAEIEQMIRNYHLLGGVMSGDLVNNSKILNGSLNNLRTAWIGLRNTLAEVFLPIIIPVVQWLTRAVAVVNMFIRAIFGKDIVVASSGIADVASTYDGYTDSANTATDATNGVTEAVERLKRVTMGFDELNKLPGVDKTTGTSGSSGDSGVSQLPSGGSYGALDLPTTEDLGLDGIANWLETNQQKIIDVRNLLITLAGAAIAAFCFFHGNIVGGMAGLAIAGYGISLGIQEGGIWDRLFDNIKGVWTNVKTWFSQSVAPVFTKDFWSKKWDSVKDGAAAMWTSFKESAFVKFFTETLKDKVVTLTGKVVDGAKSVRELLSAAWDKIKNKTSELKTKFSDSYSKTRQALAGAWDKIKTKTSTLSTKFKDGYSKTRSTLTSAWNKIKTKTSTLSTKFKDSYSKTRSRLTSSWNTIKTKTSTLSTKFNDGYSNTRKRLTSAWTTIKSKTSTLSTKFSDGYSNTRKTLLNAWDTIKSKSATLTVTFKDSFTSAIKSAWNGLVTAINSAIGVINKIPKVNIPKLPYLATGGIVTSATTAVIGEAGKEAVLPLEKNTGWMDALADKIAARNGGGTSAPTKIVLAVDGKELGQVTIDNINSITKQTGSLPLRLV